MTRIYDPFGVNSGPNAIEFDRARQHGVRDGETDSQQRDSRQPEAQFAGRAHGPNTHESQDADPELERDERYEH
jgi:hypothetical protein